MFKKITPSAANSEMREKHIKLPMPGLGKKKAAHALTDKPPAASAPAAAKPAAAASPAKPSAPSKKAKGGGGLLGKLLPLVLLVALAGGAYFAYTRFFAGRGETPAAPAAENAAAIPNEQPDSAKSLRVQPTAKPAAARPPVMNCAGAPKFLNKVGLAGDVTFATNENGIRGVILFGAPTGNSDAATRYQHQSWSSGGFLDAFVLDKNGNAYFAPSPRTGLGIATPKNQDQIYKMNTRDGVLAPYVTLPSAAPASPENVYGVLGLTFDCESNTLFAASVNGSNATTQAGRIYQLDLGTGQIIGQRDNLDAYGMAIRATANGKQLVFGSPRDGQIRALDLDAAGIFQGDPRTIATLNDPQRARKISFANENEMIVSGAEFDFTKASVSQETQVRFTYDAANNAWSVGQ